MRLSDGSPCIDIFLLNLINYVQGIVQQALSACLVADLNPDGHIAIVFGNWAGIVYYALT